MKEKEDPAFPQFAILFGLDLFSESILTKNKNRYILVYGFRIDYVNFNNSDDEKGI